MKTLNKVLSGAVLLVSIYANASVLTTDNITVNFDDNSGAISTFTAFGTDYFNPGANVSDYGFAIEGDSSSFSLAATTGGSSFLNLLSFSDATEEDNSYTANGTFGTFGIFTREFNVVDDLDVLSITTTFTNTSDADFNLLQFETFDPDQGSEVGLGTNTINDVVDVEGIPGLVAATSVNTNGLNPFFVTSPFATATEAGGLFRINSNAGLLDVLNTPVDANGAIRDLGSHVVINSFIAASETVSFTTFIGTTSGDLASALGVLTDAVTPSNVPEPSTTILFGLTLAGFVLRKKIYKA